MASVGNAACPAGAAGRRSEATKTRLRVAFCHPDLGIGGAERLVVDAASELASRGHQVQVFTAHHDPAHCFPETLDGRFEVRVYGDFLPRHVLGRFHALCAYLRCAWVALCMVLLHSASFDLALVDQVSAVIPILRLKPGLKILFYCHFPDLLLAQHGSPWSLRALYRALIDWLEQTTTGMAHCVVVNSQFTAAMFARTFRRLSARGLTPAVLYPAVALPKPQGAPGAAGAETAAAGQDGTIPGVSSQAQAPFFLSLNRFERKKEVETAIRALGVVQRGPRAASSPTVLLVVAGGYDTRLPENVEYLEELKRVAEEEGVLESVRFLTNISDGQKAQLLGSTVAVLYTPQNEHFGLVPLEAMAHGVPVVACNSGGPTESILDGTTGFLCEPTAVSFGVAMTALLGDSGRRERMGAAARRRVEDAFSRNRFGKELEGLLTGLLREE